MRRRRAREHHATPSLDADERSANPTTGPARPAADLGRSVRRRLRRGRGQGLEPRPSRALRLHGAARRRRGRLRLRRALPNGGRRRTGGAPRDRDPGRRRTRRRAGAARHASRPRHPDGPAPCRSPGGGPVSGPRRAGGPSARHPLLRRGGRRSRRGVRRRPREPPRRRRARRRLHSRLPLLRVSVDPPCRRLPAADEGGGRRHAVRGGALRDGGRPASRPGGGRRRLLVRPRDRRAAGRHHRAGRGAGRRCRPGGGRAPAVRGQVDRSRHRHHATGRHGRRPGPRPPAHRSPGRARAAGPLGARRRGHPAGRGMGLRRPDVLDAPVAPGHPAVAMDLPRRSHSHPDLVGRQHPGLVPAAVDDGYLVSGGCDRAGDRLRLGPARGVPAAARHAGAASFRRPALLRSRQPSVEPLRLDRYPAGRHEPHVGRIPAGDPGAGPEPAARPGRARPRAATTAVDGPTAPVPAGRPPADRRSGRAGQGRVARSISRS